MEGCNDGVATHPEAWIHLLFVNEFLSRFVLIHKDEFYVASISWGCKTYVAQCQNNRIAITSLRRLCRICFIQYEAIAEATLDLVKRYTKRAEVSLFDAADAAAKQIDEATGVKPEAAKTVSAEPVKTK